MLFDVNNRMLFDVATLAGFMRNKRVSLAFLALCKHTHARTHEANESRRYICRLLDVLVYSKIFPFCLSHHASCVLTPIFRILFMNSCNIQVSDKSEDVERRQTMPFIV